MLVLFETALGYALFKVTDEKKLCSVEDIYKIFESPEKAQKLYILYNIALNSMHLKNLRKPMMLWNQLASF